MFSSIEIKKLQTDPIEFQNIWQKLDFDNQGNLLQQFISGECHPEISRIILSNFGVARMTLRLKHNEFGNLFCHLLKQSIIDQPYSEAIKVILLAYPGKETQVISVVVNLLENNLNFRNEFLKDDKFLPWAITFKKQLVEIINIEHPGLIKLLEEMNTTKRDENFAFLQMKELFQFTDPLTPQQADVIKISLFLTDIELVEKQLAKLEEILKDSLANAKGNTDGQKIFMEYFTQWAIDNHFSQFAKLYKELSPTLFFEVLADKSLLLDKAFRGYFHGEWIHLIQVWCVANYAKEMSKKQETFISTSLTELISWIGKQGGNIWTRIFDEVTFFKNWPSDGWRSPTVFNEYLCSKKCAKEFPTLHQIIMTQAQKATKNYDKKPAFEYKQFKKE